jgi:hypothetical protein
MELKFNNLWYYNPWLTPTHIETIYIPYLFIYDIYPLEYVVYLGSGRWK